MAREDVELLRVCQNSLGQKEEKNWGRKGSKEEGGKLESLQNMSESGVPFRYATGKVSVQQVSMRLEQI